jgi:hypothetical protein
MVRTLQVGANVLKVLQGYVKTRHWQETGGEKKQKELKLF